MLALMPMGFLMARRTEGDQILGCVIAQLAPPLDMMDLKIFHTTARLATPAVSLQNITTKLAKTLPDQASSGVAGHGSVSKYGLQRARLHCTGNYRTLKK